MEPAPVSYHPDFGTLLRQPWESNAISFYNVMLLWCGCLPRWCQEDRCTSNFWAPNHEGSRSLFSFKCLLMQHMHTPHSEPTYWKMKALRHSSDCFTLLSRSSFSHRSLAPDRGQALCLPLSMISLPQQSRMSSKLVCPGLERNLLYTTGHHEIQGFKSNIW